MIREIRYKYIVKHYFEQNVSTSPMHKYYQIAVKNAIFDSALEAVEYMKESITTQTSTISVEKLEL